MNINKDLLERSDNLYVVKNWYEFFNRLTWTINYENNFCIVNKIHVNTKIHDLIVDENRYIRIYGTDKISEDYAMVNCFLCKNDKKIEDVPFFSKQMPILSTLNSYFYHQIPLLQTQKMYITIHE